jgi:hypothetical protein
MALEREIARDLGTMRCGDRLRVGGVSSVHAWNCGLPDGRLDGATASFGVIRSLLAAVPRLRIVYSCGVGDPGCSELAPPPAAACAATCFAIGCEARLHDYFPVSPVLLPAGPRRAVSRPVPWPNGGPCTSGRTRTGHAITTGGVAAPLARISCRPATRSRRSPQAARDLQRGLPVAVAPRVGASAAPMPCRNGWRIPMGSAALGVLGNLNAQKGARVIEALARQLDAAGDPRPIVVIGNVDAGFSLPARVRIHGGYDRRDDIAALARRLRHRGMDRTPRSGPRPIPSPRGRRWPPACR